MEEECPFCRVTVLNKGLVLPFNQDGSVHDTCFNDRFIIVRVQ